MAEGKTEYRTMSREEQLELRWKADNRDQPDALFEGQRIIGFREWKSSSLYAPGQWCVSCVLEDGTRLIIDEGKG